MRKLLFLITIIISIKFVCKPKNNRVEIFSGLSKSYILNKGEYREEKEFFEEFKINRSTYSKDSIEYHQAFHNLITSNPNIIGELLKFEGNKEWSLWVRTTSPYSQTLDKTDLINKSLSAIILIDNYILNSDVIIIRPYVYKIKYSWLKNWFKEGRSRDDLLNEYRVYIKNLQE